jgi:hypothetical protein
VELLAFWLLAAGVCDLVRGAREFWSSRRLITAVVAGSLTWLVVPFALFTTSGWTAVAVAVAIPVLLVMWVVVTQLTVNERRLPPAVALIGFLGVTVLALALSGSLTYEVRPRVETWFGDLAVPALRGASFPTVVLGAAVLLFLMSTSNVVVRMVLGGANVPVESTEQVLRAGRLIGAMERLFIFTLTVAGAPGAAAVVVGAKSLLRFPEISQRAAVKTDPVTEYFLVGSLTSWLLALLFVPLFS